MGLERTRLELGDRGRQRSSGPSGRVHGERHGALEEGGRRGQTAPRLSPVGGAFELTRDVLVGARGCLRQVPAATVRIEGPVRLLSQCPMHRSGVPRPMPTSS